MSYSNAERWKTAADRERSLISYASRLRNELSSVRFWRIKRRIELRRAIRLTLIAAGTERKNALIYGALVQLEQARRTDD